MTGHETEKINKLKGIAVSPGIIIGKARLVDRSSVKILYQYLISDGQVGIEVERFKEAVIAAREQILSVKNQMPDAIKGHAFILDTHLMFMDDSMLYDATIDTILKEKINAEWALRKSVQEIMKLFGQIDDEYIGDRIRDVEHVAERILRNLAGKEQESLSEIDERVIIVAKYLSPADTSEINIGKVMGFITDKGGRTSHTAIIAKALKIPAVVGVDSATYHIQDGSLLIVDGNTGEVIIEPDDEIIIAYQEKRLQQERYRSSIARIGHLPAETLDGNRIAVRANIEFLEEVVAAKDNGAEGIGLYRTEYLYLKSEERPSEEELFEDYKEVAEIMSPAPVTIRSLDLGGDRFSSDLGMKKETNPALGLRAIRFCLREPQIFKSQLRAILRASAYGHIRLMLPMISGLHEVLDAKKILKGVMDELDRENVKYDRDMEVGILIEIPSAVTMADVLAKHVDFFSIGTNDLIQYALAIDRINEDVAYMYEPFHPAILRMILQVIEAARKERIKVALCGEMAGDPLCVSILVGMGLDELSMNAQVIPMIKKIIRSMSMEEAQADLHDILQLDEAAEVREFIVKRMAPLKRDLDEQGYYFKLT